MIASRLLVASLTLALLSFTAPQTTYAFSNSDSVADQTAACASDELIADLEVLRGWQKKSVFSEVDGDEYHAMTAYTRVIRIHCKGHDIRYLVGGGQYFAILTFDSAFPHYESGQVAYQLHMKLAPFRNTGTGYYFIPYF